MLQARLVDRLGALSAACLLAGGSALAGDLSVLDLAGGGLRYWGESQGIGAYSMAVTACNASGVELAWTSADHPVLGQNLYRLHDGRFEQLGQSWVFHEFCALNELGCASCQATGCDSLGSGCASSHSASIVDGQFGGPKSAVQAAAGSHTDGATTPIGPAAIRGRLQVALSDLDPALFPGARYFVEAQYLSAGDAATGAAGNNCSWREVQVSSPTQVLPVGPTHVGESALHAWRAADPAVVVSEVWNFDEQGAGRNGLFTVAERVTDLGGTWRYDLALHNQTSSAAARALKLGWSSAASLGLASFHDVDYHSGEVYDGTDWGFTVGSSELSVACAQTHAQAPLANALRWGTCYSVRIETDAEPRPGVGLLELFAPIGSASVLSFPCTLPVGPPSAATPLCFGEGSTAPCPCGNSGLAGEGCLNSTGSGATLSASGSASLAAADLALHVSGAAPQQFGVFVQGGSEVALPFRDGLLCAGNPKLRIETVQLDAAGAAQSSATLAATPGLVVGALRVYQLWYRDPSGPCGAGSNLSSALRVSWLP